MDNITTIAASGMQSRIRALDMLANNLANATSGGFKADREVNSTYQSASAMDPMLGQIKDTPWVKTSWTDFSQGILQPTGDPFDIALSGPGFLRVLGPSGPLYTRNGSLRLSAKGDLLAAENRPVLDKNQKPVKVDPTRKFEVDRNGIVTQDGKEVAQLSVVEFAKPQELVKAGTSYFQTSAEPQAARETEIRQGVIEGSNVGAAESAARLVAVLRQFEMLQKAITLGGEMSRRALDEITKVQP